MDLTTDALGSFGALATAIGLLDPDGQPNASWFGDPVGSATATGNQHGLRHVLADDAQRDALLGFVDDVLGPPDRADRAGRTWVPLFRETTPQVTVFAVVGEAGGAVHVGVGVEHSTTGALPRIATRVHVPLFAFPERGQSAPAPSGGLPGWLLLGHVGARVELGVDATFVDAPPPPGDPSLGGVAVQIGVPTAAGDDLEIAFELRDLQLPGAPQPRSFSLDASSLTELGRDVFELVLGLLRAQLDALSGIDPALAPARAVAGLLGLRAVPDLPPLPLADLPTRGVAALVEWVEGVLSVDAARDAWLGQLADLVGGVVVPADDAVLVTAGPVSVTVGVRVDTGSAGHPVLVPWAAVALTPETGVEARLAADLLRADTATGTCTALPAVRLEAVFGDDAGGPALIAGAAPHVGSLHAGVALDATGRPAFVLTLHDVTVTAGGSHHDLLDLSSPQAAMTAASSVVTGALSAAIADLGAPGVLLNRLLGIDPPAGIAALDAGVLLTDPVAAVATYWSAVIASAPAAADVLGQLEALITGAAVAPAPGDGTAAAPWVVTLVDGVAVRVWKDGTTVTAALAGGVVGPVGDDYQVSAEVALTLLRVDVTSGVATLASDVNGAVALTRVGGETARIELGAVALEADRLALSARWSVPHGLRVGLEADGLAIAADVLGDERVPLPLPTFGADGHLTLGAPDWDALEPALAALLGELGVPLVDALVTLLGWSGGSLAGEPAHLPLAGLLGGDPGAAVNAWLADLVLDCDRVRLALGPVAALLSGFTLGSPIGAGSARSPFRTPVAGEPRAPGVAVWLEPGCPPVVRDETRERLTTLTTAAVPSSRDIVGVLSSAATVLPDVVDLLVGRPSIVDGLDLVAARWLGTDGLVGAPATLPTGVAPVTLAGRSYDELVALGSAGLLVGDVTDPFPTAVVHAGCEAHWVADRPPGTAFDRSTDAGAAGAGIPATGAGIWFVRLPPAGTGVAEQAARLTGVLSERTEPVTVVAYGACGAAAVRAAATVGAVEQVVTVGSPWGPVAVDSVTTGLGGDAMQLLHRLRRPRHDDWPDRLLAQEATPLQRTHLLVERTLTTAPPDLPSAAGEAPRAGLSVRAVFGALDADAIGRGLGAYVAAGLRARLSAAAAAAVTPVHTALHAGIDLPLIDLDVGGLLVGAGVTLELLRVARATPDPGLEGSVVRGAIVDLHLGVNDGWLVGGPGSPGTVGHARWMSARVEVPLDGRVGTAELVLHEARGFGIDRERWVVTANPAGPNETAAVPEVRVLLSDVVARVRAASPHLASLLDALGITRRGGLDPDGLDRLLHDTATTARAQVSAARGDVAAALRGLVPGATGAGSHVAWTVGPATLDVDLATGALHAALTIDEPGVPAAGIDVTATAAAVTAAASLGALDPFTGGARVVAATTPSPTVAVEWAGPAGSAHPPTSPRRIELYPTFDTAGMSDVATAALPALTAVALLGALRATVVSPALDVVLEAAGLVSAPDPLGDRSLAFPLGLFDEPAGWLRQASVGWRTDTAGTAVAVLDALQPVVAPGPGPGWVVAQGVRLLYTADAGNRLRLSLDVTLDADLGGRTVTTHVAGGLVVGATGEPPRPILTVSGAVEGAGLALDVDPAAVPPVRLALLRSSGPPLALYPAGPGVGDVLEGVGEAVLPGALNAVAAHRSDAGASAAKRVGQAVFDLGDALDLRDDTEFTAAKLTAFAADPAARLAARLPQLVGTAITSVAAALDPGGALVSATTPVGGRVSLQFGSAPALTLTLDASGATPAVELAAEVDIDGVGHLALERLRLSADGVDVAARLGPVPLGFGPFTLRPLVLVHAGSAARSDRMLGVGLALDDDGVRSVQVRFTLAAVPPTLTAVAVGPSGESLGAPEQAAQWLLALALSVAGGVVVDAVGPALTPMATATLQGVVFADAAGSTELDPGLALDLLDPDAVLGRLMRLAWNAAEAPALALTIDGTVTVALARSGDHLGLNVALVPGRRFVVADGDTKVELEVDANWVDPVVPAGLSILVLEGSTPTALTVSPSVAVGGLGLRFTKESGPLLPLGPVSLDGLAVHVYGEAAGGGGGGGVNLELTGLSFAPGAGSGTNAVANGIMNDAGRSAGSGRPAFSPSLAVQQHPGHAVAVSLRAGPPPGPWWVVIQRQLGPLYLEQVGFNSVEAGGQVTRVSLLFDGRVAIFGLTASVDQLSLNWDGGDLLDISSWSVDLMGLAIAADMSGVSLAGGILKTIGPPPDTGPVSYVGMLLGRFGVYGLSVFGGYTNDNGQPSFFVFGGVNGPIGGPPAFFLTGLGGGLGINRGLRVPDDPSTFNTFPFIQALDPAAQLPEDPMDELRRLNAYFPVQPGSFWFAAGISFNSFALVDGIAVVAVSFGDGLEINLLGLARVALPRPQVALVSIELGLLARFSTREGVFIIRAGLTENSWLLYPEVRLTGGFAFATWWKGTLAGQCVVTLGGYHPDFHRDGYPAVARLGLAWRITDEIVVKGGSYFALTSEAVMAGVDVDVSADFGWAWARVAFGAHAIISFDPFYYEASIYARVSAGVTVDTWLGTFSFSVSLGAHVRVWGPEFSGRAGIEVGPCTVTVPFGSQTKVEGRTLSWSEFVAKYLEEAAPGRARALSSITGRGTLPSATGGDRAAPTADGSPERPFEVFAEFELTVVTTIPTSSIDVDLAGGPVAVPVVRSDGMAAMLGLKPIKSGNLASTLRVRLLRHDPVTGAWVETADALRALGGNLGAVSPRPEGSGVSTSAFPIGAWGQPDLPGLPAPPLPKGDVLNAGSALRLVAEAAIPAPGPEIDASTVVVGVRRPLPLQADGATRSAILTTAATVPVPAVGSVGDALAAAERMLFAGTASDVGVEGLVAGPPRSALARAAYRGEVAAPPLFGNLADGMAAANAADADAERHPPPPAMAGRPTRPPTMAGYLAAGAGDATRPAGTTVVDKRIKRRPAPTTDSVRARLGSRLPVSLLMTALVGAVQRGTVLAPRPPRTVVPGAVRSYDSSGTAVDGLVAGVRRADGAGRRAAAPALRSGDVVVLTLPDAAVDTVRARPALQIEGRARVVALLGDGTVAVDDVSDDAARRLPAGTALVAAHADGDVAVDGGDGLAGWHSRSRVATLGSHAALAAGCVVVADGLPAVEGTRWTTAGELLGQAAAVRTRFSRPARTVVIVLEEGADDRLDPIDLELIGARRVTSDGADQPPTVILSGGQAALVYAVAPDEEADAIEVQVRAGADWRVTGVLAGDLDADVVAASLTRRGVVGATGRLLVTSGPGCRLRWRAGRDGRRGGRNGGR